MIYVTEPCWVWSRYNKEGCVFHIVCTYFSIISRGTKKGLSFGLKTVTETMFLLGQGKLL